MNCLAPSEAATLATDVYSVNNGDQIEPVDWAVMPNNSLQIITRLMCIIRMLGIAAQPAS